MESSHEKCGLWQGILPRTSNDTASKNSSDLYEEVKACFLSTSPLLESQFGERDGPRMKLDSNDEVSSKGPVTWREESAIGVWGLILRLSALGGHEDAERKQRGVLISHQVVSLMTLQTDSFAACIKPQKREGVS
jgi:hypothetical protein